MAKDKIEKRGAKRRNVKPIACASGALSETIGNETRY